MLITIMDNNWKIEYLEVSDIISSSIDIDKLKKSILLELSKQTDKNINDKILKSTTVNKFFNKK